MLRFFAGVLSTLLFVAAGFFVWKSQAESEDKLPAPPPGAYAGLLQPKTPETPPAAPEKSREEKRFARADRNDDGRIVLNELYEPRRKAFARLDTDGDGRLSFEEWAVTTRKKFEGADADRNGSLTPAEFETTKPKPRKSKTCAC